MKAQRFTMFAAVLAGIAALVFVGAAPDPSRGWRDVERMAGTPPVIVWDTPSGVTRFLNFPAYETGFRTKLRLTSSHVETAGDVVAKGLLSGYDLVEVALEGFEDQGFEDGVVAFWASAGRGKPFRLSLEGDNSAFYPNWGEAVAGFSVVEVNTGGSSAPFPNGREMVIESRFDLPGGDASKRSSFVITSQQEFPPFSGIWRLNLDKPFEFGFGDGEAYVHSRWSYPYCVALNEDDPLRRDPGGTSSFVLRFRAYANITVP